VGFGLGHLVNHGLDRGAKHAAKAVVGPAATSKIKIPPPTPSLNLPPSRRAESRGHGNPAGGSGHSPHGGGTIPRDRDGQPVGGDLGSGTAFFAAVSEFLGGVGSDHGGPMPGAGAPQATAEEVGLLARLSAALEAADGDGGATPSIPGTDMDGAGPNGEPGLLTRLSEALGAAGDGDLVDGGLSSDPLGGWGTPPSHDPFGAGVGLGEDAGLLHGGNLQLGRDDADVVNLQGLGESGLIDGHDGGFGGFQGYDDLSAGQDVSTSAFPADDFAIPFESYSGGAFDSSTPDWQDPSQPFSGDGPDGGDW
jgi:hypothetical protein